MKKFTIALISGGISSERLVSLKGGDQVNEHLDRDKYRVIRYDPKTDISRLVAQASQIDAALIIMHGEYGEDGRIQGLLDLLNIPYQGSGVIGSALAMNKLLSKQIYEQSGLLVPSYIAVKRGEKIDPDRFVNRLGLPLVIKPVKGGSSIGMSMVKSVDFLKDALDKAFAYDDTVLAEAFVKGIELTCGVIGNDKPEALPVVEIVPDKGHLFFDYEAKYTPGSTQEICPARIDDVLTHKVQSCALMAHTALACDGYSRTDMIAVDKKTYLLETNTIPGMTQTSLFPFAAKKAGLTYSQLLDKLIELSLERHKKT